MLWDWYREEFGNQSERIRAINDLLSAGHNGLAESVVVRSLKAKYRGETEKVGTNTSGLIKVRSANQEYYI